MASEHLESQLGFLARDQAYERAKPYSLRFEPPDDTPRDNIHTEEKRATIHDARPLKPTLAVNGFTLTSFPTELQYDDFRDHDKIERVYASELQTHLRKVLGARHVRVIDYVVRRRHPGFPISTGERYESQQPAAAAHIDFSHEEGIRMLETLYGDRAGQILQHRWQIVNAWRPLKGPLFDWPLAVCDAQTFDQDRDSQVADVVYPEWAYENILVHSHPDQRWHYFSAMRPEETMLFKCTDSDPTAAGPCPHASFPHPQTVEPAEPRESIESRAFVLWAPLDTLPEEVGTLYGERG